MLEKLMEYIGFYFGKAGEEQLRPLNWCGNMLELRQNKDYRVTKYTLVIESADGYSYRSRRHGEDVDFFACAVKRVELVYADGVTEVPSVDRKFTVPIDFNKRAQKVILYFKYDLAEPLGLTLDYIEADRAAWDKRIADEEAARLEKEREEARQSTVKLAHISHRTGENLVNIYFQPCAENCAKTVVKLYADENMIAEYECEKGVYFRSVTGLAYGEYSYTVSQFDGEGGLLFVTDKISFSLGKPRPQAVSVNWSR